MVLREENLDDTSSIHHLLFSDSWPYEIWSGSLFRDDYEEVQSQLIIFTLWICPSGWELVGTHDGRVIVPVYDWVSFLGQYFRKLPNIKKFHHFSFTSENPGMFFLKQFVSSLEQSFMMLKNNGIFPPSSTLPCVINPVGLTKERKEYLYREIRQFIVRNWGHCLSSTLNFLLTMNSALWRL